MKRITKRRKIKLTQFYKEAKKLGSSISHLRMRSKAIQSLRYDKQLAKQEGTYIHWPDSVFNGFMLMVSVRTKYTGKEVGLKIYLSKDEIPLAFQGIWTALVKGTL